MILGHDTHKISGLVCFCMKDIPLLGVGAVRLLRAVASIISLRKLQTAVHSLVACGSTYLVLLTQEPVATKPALLGRLGSAPISILRLRGKAGS
jgi:hypothetical protein